MREDAAEHLFPLWQPVLGPVIGAMDRDIAVAGPNEIENRLLLAGCELELVVAAIGHDDQDVVFTDRGRFQDGGVLTDCNLEPAGILERGRQVQCLIAVSVMLALPAGKHEDLGAIGHFLLRQGRMRQEARPDHAQTDDTRSTHGRYSCLSGSRGAGSVRSRLITMSRADCPLYSVVA